MSFRGPQSGPWESVNTQALHGEEKQNRQRRKRPAFPPRAQRSDSDNRRRNGLLLRRRPPAFPPSRGRRQRHLTTHSAREVLKPSVSSGVFGDFLRQRRKSPAPEGAERAPCRSVPLIRLANARHLPPEGGRLWGNTDCHGVGGDCLCSRRVNRFSLPLVATSGTHP